MNDSAAPRPDTPATRRDDWRTIGLIALFHGLSHFFHLLLPPLFPYFVREFGLSYSALGLIVSAFFLVSGVGQWLSGFLVDRVGARPVAFASIALFALSAVLAASAQGWWTLLAAAVLAGLGNAPMHPVDYSVLNLRVSPRNLGHAYAVHGIVGNLGWAAAPAFYIGTLWLFDGNWRLSYLLAAVLALLVGITLWLNRTTLDTPAQRAARTVSTNTTSTTDTAAAQGTDAGASTEHVMAFLKLPIVWMCFGFFFFNTMGLTAVQSFAPTVLDRLYGLGFERTSFVVTGYMLAGALGMVLGGFLVARERRLEGTIAVALALAAALMLTVASGALPANLALALTVCAGLGTGIASPSRDMLIRRAAPAGATGRVYGTVYSGLDAGFAVAAPIFGALIDHGRPNAVFALAAGAFIISIFSAASVGARLRT